MSNDLKKPYEISIWKDIPIYKDTDPLSDADSVSIYSNEEHSEVFEAQVWKVNSQLWPNVLNMTDAQFDELYSHIIEEGQEYPDWNGSYDISEADYNAFAEELEIVLATVDPVEGKLSREEYILIAQMMNAENYTPKTFVKYIYATFTDYTKTRFLPSKEGASYVGVYTSEEIKPDIIDRKMHRPDSIKIGDFTWYPLGYSFFDEEKYAIIGSNTMTAPHRAINPVLTKNINGSNTLTFTLYSRYYDESVEKFVDNPFLIHITNESKIKLKYDNQWYDFIVKNVEEDSEEHSFTYTCQDMFITELSKTGFNIVLDNELQNNQGTIIELAEKVLEESDWDLDKANSDTLTQFISEPLYVFKLITDEDYPDSMKAQRCLYPDQEIEILDDTIIYVPYSILHEEKQYFQFIYHADGIYTIDEDGNIMEEKDDSFYGGYTISGNASYNTEEEGIVILNNTYRFLNLGISHTYKGKRLSRLPRTTYDPITAQVVNIYDKNGQEYYGYETTDYIEPNFKVNLIVNGTNYESIQGWNSNGNNTLEIYTSPPWEDILNGQYTELDIKDFLHINSSSTPYFNSVIKSNFDVNKFTKGMKYVFRVKAYTDSLGTIPCGQNFKAEISNYIVNETLAQYIPTALKWFEFKSTNMIKDEFAFSLKNITLLTEFEALKDKLYTYDEDENIYYKVAEEEEWDNAISYYIKEDDYYYCVAECSDNLSQDDFELNNIGLFIYPTVSGTSNVYIKDIQLFGFEEKEVNILEDYEQDDVITSEGRPLCPGEFKDAEAKTQYYYFEKPDGSKSASGIEYIILDEPDESYKPVYDENFSKIKSISASDSNRFNIIQDLSEAFECWAKFKIEHDPETGKIIVNNYKRVYPEKFKNGVDYYIKTGINELEVIGYEVIDKYILINELDKYNKELEYYTKEVDTHLITNLIFDDNYYECGTIDVATFEKFKSEFYINDKGVYIPLSKDAVFDASEKYYEKDFTHRKRGDLAGNIYEIRQPDSNQEYYEYVPGRQVKSISFKEYITVDNYAGFKYGINLTSIQRTLDGESIVSKLIVKDNSNEFAPDGFCTVARAEDNPSKQTFLYNFDYYVQQGLLDREVVDNDLFEYYNRLRNAQDNRNEKIDELAEKQMQLDKLSSQLDIIKKLQTETTAEIQRLDLELYNFDENHKTYDDIINKQDYGHLVITAKEIQSYLKDIYSLRKKLNSYDAELAELNPKYEQLRSELERLNRDFAKDANLITNINREFYTKYSRFIQEGSWSSEDYYDNDLYYYDALSVLNTSKSPQTTYTINVIEVSQIEGLEPYSFDVGHKTYVEDVEFFGYQYNSNKTLAEPLTPYKEEVIVNEVSYSLDSPEENTITVQNYKTRFEDLFERISATVASLEFNQGSYGRAAAAITPDGEIAKDILQKTLDNNVFNFVSPQQGVTISNEGIVVKTKDGVPSIKIASGGIYSWEGEDWSLALSGRGIDSSKLSIGRIDTSQIYIMSNGETSFRWDDKGITAYNFDNEGKTDYNKFVRLDKYGVYGVERINDGNRDWVVDPGLDIPIYEQIKQNAFFGLTYDGFFLKSAHGDGYVEISDENDIKVKTYAINYFIDENGHYNKDGNARFNYTEDTVTRVEIGNLDEDNYVLFNVASKENFEEYKTNLYGKFKNEYHSLYDGDYDVEEDVVYRYEKIISDFILTPLCYRRVYKTLKNTGELVEADIFTPALSYDKTYDYFTYNLETENYDLIDIQSYFEILEADDLLYKQGIQDVIEYSSSVNYYLADFIIESVYSEEDFRQKRFNLYTYNYKNALNTNNNYETYYKYTVNNNVTEDNYWELVREGLYILVSNTYIKITNEEYDSTETYYQPKKYIQCVEVTNSITSENFEDYVLGGLYIRDNNEYIQLDENSEYSSSEHYYQTILPEDYDAGNYLVRKYDKAIYYDNKENYYIKEYLDIPIDISDIDEFEAYSNMLYIYNYTLIHDEIYDEFEFYYNSEGTQLDIKELYFNSHENLYKLSLDTSDAEEFFYKYIYGNIYFKDSKYGLRLKDIYNNTVLQTDDSGQLVLEGDMTVSGKIQAHWVDTSTPDNPNDGYYDLYIDDTGLNLGEALVYDSSSHQLYLNMNATFTDEEHMRSLVKELQEGTLQISIESSQGLIFKGPIQEGTPITVLTAKVFSRGKLVDDISPFGRICWYKIEGETETPVSDPTRSVLQITINEEDVDDLATYAARLIGAEGV